jgi:peroxiredoxin
LPSVNKLHAEFKSKGLEVLLINFREDPALVKRTATERGYTSPVLLDQSGDVAGKRYGVWGPPTVYLVDPRGQLLGRIVGARDWSAPAAHRLVQSLVDAAKP